MARFLRKRVGRPAIVLCIGSCPLGSGAKSFHDLPKARVVVAGVVAGIRRAGRAAAYDPPCTTVARSRCPDGVVPVVAPLVRGQQAFPVVKDAAVLVVWEGAAFADETEGGASLRGTLGQCDGVGSARGRSLPGFPRERGQNERGTQSVCNTCRVRPDGDGLQHQLHLSETTGLPEISSQ